MSPKFLYYVKIIGTGKCTQWITRQLHSFNGKFPSVTSIKVLRMEKLGDHVPDTINFNVGYFECKQSKKRWLCCQEDLESMYKSHKNGDEVTLWCEAKTNKRKKDDDDPPCVSKTQSKEAEVDSIYSELKKKHHESYEVPKLRLWARMIVGGLHDSHQTYLRFILGNQRREKNRL